MRFKLNIFGIYSNDDTIRAAELNVASSGLAQTSNKTYNFREDCQNESASKLIA